MSLFVSLPVLVVMGIMPSLIWLVFYLTKDAHPEPKRFLVITFLLGMLITPIVAFIETNINCVVSSSHSSTLCIFSNSTPPLFVFTSSIIFIFLISAFIEEISKFLVVRFTVWKKRAFDEPVDSMIYLIVSALGFAAAENILAAIGLHLQIGSFADSYESVIQLLILRFVGATLLHTFASGIIGYFVALHHFHIRKTAKRSFLLIRGFIYATIIHALFNILIESSEQLSIPGFSLAVLAVIIIGFIIIMVDFNRLTKYT